MSLLRRYTHSIEDLGRLVGALGVSILVLQAVGLGCLGWATAGRRAGWMVYGLALGSPAAWTQLGWGGFGQFLGTTFGALALTPLVWALKARSEPLRLMPFALGGAALGLVAVSHVYSVPFFAAACTALLATRKGPTVRITLSFLGAAALTSLPGWAPLLRVATVGLSNARSERDITDALIPLSEWLQNLSFHPAMAALASLPFLVAVAAGRGRAQLTRAAFWLPWTAGAAVLALVTPPILLDRVVLLTGNVLTLAIGVALASAPKPRLVGLTLAVWAFAATALTLAENDHSLREGGRLTLDEARLLQRNAPRSEAVVIATDTPNVEGYWLRGLTGGRALIGDRYRWYASQRERDESSLVQTFMLGEFALGAGPLTIIANSPVENRATLVFDDGREFCPLFVVTALSGTGVISGSGQSLVIDAEGIADLSLSPFDGSRLLSATNSAEGVELAWEFRYSSYRPRGLVRRVRVAGAKANRSGAGVLLRVTARATMDGPAQFLRPVRSVWTAEMLERAGGSLFVASPSRAERFSNRHHFQLVDRGGRLQVFSSIRGRAGSPPGALTLTPFISGARSR